MSDFAEPDQQPDQQLEQQVPQSEQSSGVTPAVFGGDEPADDSEAREKHDGKIQEAEQLTDNPVPHAPEAYDINYGQPGVLILILTGSSGALPMKTVFPVNWLKNLWILTISLNRPACRNSSFRLKPGKSRLVSCPVGRVEITGRIWGWPTGLCRLLPHLRWLR